MPEQFLIQIERSNGEGGVLQVIVSPGHPLYVLGSNGAGKSTLLQKLFSVHHGAAIRIAAHRQNHFDSNDPSLTAQARVRISQTVRQHDVHPQSRWRDDYGLQRVQAAIFDLIAAENARARAIARAVKAKDIARVEALNEQLSPIDIINELFRLSNLAVSITISETDVVLATKSGSKPYSIAQLSDGERSALILAAVTLTAPADQLLIVDEPERHLHKSIAGPLLRELFSRRKDCAFVVSTHDVALAEEAPGAQILLLRDGGPDRRFDVDVISDPQEIPDDVKRDILGARRTILFVEGTEQSLDRPLYSLLFPGASIVAKGACADVERAVAGIRGAQALHWVTALGIVDGDRRPAAELRKLKEKGVFPIPVLAVESIYYSAGIQLMLAARQQMIDGVDAPLRCERAKTAALASIALHADRLSRRAAEAAIRDTFRRQTPGKPEIDAGGWHTGIVYIAGLVETERMALAGALQSGELDVILRAYPVRATPALDMIATELGFQDREHYEAAVRKLLMDDSAALAQVKALFSDVAAALT